MKFQKSVAEGFIHRNIIILTKIGRIRIRTGTKANLRNTEYTECTSDPLGALLVHWVHFWPTGCTSSTMSTLLINCVHFQYSECTYDPISALLVHWVHFWSTECTSSIHWVHLWSTECTSSTLSAFMIQWMPF